MADLPQEDLRELDLAWITAEAQAAVLELLEIAKLDRGDVLVVGCSSSEIVGGTIGKNSSIDAARAVYAGIKPILDECGVYLAVQCCEHLNRALIVEKECARRYGYEEVSVRPMPKAGGSLAATAWEEMEAPCAVEHIRAHAGLDIGGTLIGMHLRDVAVPVRLQQKTIGEAILLAARTRPKYIGGPRAQYEGSGVVAENRGRRSE